MPETITDWGDPLDYNAGDEYQLEAQPPARCCGRRMVKVRRFLEPPQRFRGGSMRQAEPRRVYHDGVECLTCRRFKKGDDGG